MRRVDPALLIVLGGVSAALHVGKLPTAIPVLRDAMGVTLVQAGFLLSLVQLAGMTLGLAVGLAADSWGLKRTSIAGLLVISLASLLGGWAQTPGTLMLLRGMEGIGLLLTSITAPNLLRRVVEPQRISVALGWWGGYMPFGAAAALLLGPLVMAYVDWRGWWWLLAIPSGTMAIWLWLRLPADGARQGRRDAGRVEGWLQRLRQTLSAPGPWLVALTFAVYSGQWLAVIGFLPTVYAQGGLAPAAAGAATALAALVNMFGSIASGRLLQAGMRPRSLLYLGFSSMGLGAFVAFAAIWNAVDPSVALVVRYTAVLAFSMVGGLVPGTLFSLAVTFAPNERTVSTTVGWMQQWSSAGQFLGPPLVGWVASRAGGWQWSWLVTGACSVTGLLLASVAGSLTRAGTPHAARQRSRP
jgi:MFS transporter, CP family, cyanate transporter